MLKDELVRSGILSAEQTARAEDYALTRGLPLDEALVFLNMADYGTLGKALSRLLEVPYRPLLPELPSEVAKDLVPLKAAQRFGVFPVHHDPDKDTLLVAARDPAEREKDPELPRLLPRALHLSFTVASGAEIRKAIEVHYLGKPYVPPKELELPEDFTIVERKETESQGQQSASKGPRRVFLVEPDPARARALKTLLGREGILVTEIVQDPERALDAIQKDQPDLALFNHRLLSSVEAEVRETGVPFAAYASLAPLLLGEALPYQDVTQALIRVVSHVMGVALAKAPEKRQEAQARARYCKLLALRLGLSPVRVDGVILAAWLSAAPLGHELATHLEQPFGTAGLLRPQEAGGRVGDKGASAIFFAVAAFQAISKRDPKAAVDPDRVRRLLGKVTGLGPGDAVLEAFIQVLRDEAFLDRLGGPPSRILLVDPERDSARGIVLRLESEGHAVEVVGQAREARKIIQEGRADLVLSETVLSDDDGLGLCKVVKNDPQTRSIPFLFLSAEPSPGLVARCLEAGADDFLEKSVDPEVLCLKIRRLLAERKAPEEGQGVRGSLSEMSFTDIIQSLTSGEKDVEIALTNDTRQARVFIQGGEVIHAVCGSKTAEEAFYDVMTWGQGTFRIIPCTGFPERHIQASAMSLLMEGARLADELESPGEEED